MSATTSDKETLQLARHCLLDHLSGFLYLGTAPPHFNQVAIWTATPYGHIAQWADCGHDAIFAIIGKISENDFNVVGPSSKISKAPRDFPIKWLCSSFNIQKPGVSATFDEEFEHGYEILREGIEEIKAADTQVQSSCVPDNKEQIKLDHEHYQLNRQDEELFHYFDFEDLDLDEPALPATDPRSVFPPTETHLCVPFAMYDIQHEPIRTAHREEKMKNAVVQALFTYHHVQRRSKTYFFARMLKVDVVIPPS